MSSKASVSSRSRCRSVRWRSAQPSLSPRTRDAVTTTTIATIAIEDRDHGNNREQGNGRRHGDARGHDHDRYDDHDRDAARGWYRAHHSHLPPGLARRDHLPPGLERQLVVRGTLPPGLRVQMHPCPHELEAMFPPPPPNYMHVVVGGNLVLVNRANFQIADVFHLQIH